jgi:uncharacterized membrane protein YuzA (DUF378 family)
MIILKTQDEWNKMACVSGLFLFLYILMCLTLIFGISKFDVYSKLFGKSTPAVLAVLCGLMFVYILKLFLISLYNALNYENNENKENKENKENTNCQVSNIL